MPYETREQLPQNVRSVLPKHAQDIYKEAFNSAWRRYAEPFQRKGDNDRETVAHKVAWSAVDRTYQKGADGVWHEK